MPELELRQFEAVVFDFDGVLADSVLTHQRARQVGYEFVAEITGDMRFIGIPQEIHDEAHLHGSNPATINAWILHQAGIIEDPHDIDAPEVGLVVAAKDEYFDCLAQEGHAPIKDALSLVRGTDTVMPGRLSIGTTARYKEEVLPFLRKHQLRRILPAKRLITRETVLEQYGKLKPSPDVYLLAKQVMSVKFASDMLVFEDSEQGIEAAKRAGATVLAVATTRSFEKLATLEGIQKPDIIAENMLHARDILGY